MEKWLAAKTTVAVSLDITMLFSSELGLANMLTDELQWTARQRIAEIPSGPIDAGLCTLSEGFTASVSQNLGTSVVGAVRRWQAAAYPSHSLATKFWVWGVLLTELQACWAASSLGDRLSLVEDASERLAVAEYLEHARGVSDQISDAAQSRLSEWDRCVEQRCADWFDIPTRLRGIVQAISAGRFWSQWLGHAEAAQVEALQRWARASARVLGVPLRYVRVPDYREVRRIYSPYSE